MIKDGHHKPESLVLSRISTLRDLHEYLISCGLAPSEASQLRSAVKRADELIGHGALDLPASPRLIFGRLKSWSPAMADMSPGSFANLKSRLRKAFQIACPALRASRDPRPLTGAWGELQALLEEGPRRALSRFFRFAEREGWAPQEISDAHLQRFEAHLRDEAMVVSWEGVSRGAIKAWNKLGEVESLPRLTPPAPKRTSYWIPEAEWPPSLRAEAEAFVASLSAASFSAAAAKPLKPGTIQQYRHVVTTLVSALTRSGLPLTALCSLADLVRPERLDQALRFLHERSEGEVTSRMFQIVLRARNIAAWCGAPPEDRERLDQVLAAVRSRMEGRRGMTEKNRGLLDHLEDQRFSDRLHLLPQTLMKQALEDPDSQWAPAKARTALAIELLLTCSMRRANLIGLELDKSIRKIGQGAEASWVVELEAEEVKNADPLRFVLPGPTAQMLEAYLAHWRPRLCGQPNPWLFPGRGQDRIDHRTMSCAIRSQSERLLGVPVTAHQFRHVSAESYLLENPDGLFTISQHLGHRDVNTTRNFYARSKQKQASRQYQEHVLRSRASAGARGGRAKARRPEPIFDKAEDLL